MKPAFCLVKNVSFLSPVGGSPPEIVATQEAEIRRMAVRSQLGQIVPKILFKKKKKNHIKKASGVAQGVGPQFKPQYHTHTHTHTHTHKRM
jgi:hypothetical protein